MNKEVQKRRNMLKRYGLLILIFLIYATLTFGQGGTPEQDRAREQIYQEANVRSRQPEQMQRIPSGLPKPPTKLTTEDEAKLAPPPEDSAKYAQFLKNNKTGIIKLLPFPNCDRRVVNVNDIKCLEAPQIFGNGAFYSFRERSHSIKNFARDIVLANEKFIGSGLFSLFSDLGNISIEDFNFSKDVKALKKFPLTKDASQFTVQKKQLINGVEINGRLYKNNVAMKIDTTYLLRSVNYSFERSFKEITVGFRVIRKDDDGSVVLIWREL